MQVTVEISGLNLERLLTLAAKEGIVIRGAERMENRALRVRIAVWHRKALLDLCARYGWDSRVAGQGCLLRAMSWLHKRPSAPAAMLLCMALTWGSAQLTWVVRIENAGKAVGEVRSYLQKEGIVTGVPKRLVPVSKLREALMLRLPDMAYVSAGYEGSILVIDCRMALEGEQALTGGSGVHLVAAQDGVITRMAVHSGTPRVEVGQAVRKGDILILGEERGEKQTTHSVQAQGDVQARMWSEGKARAPLIYRRTVETGAIARRVSLHSPWHTRMVRDAQPFASQDVSVQIQPVVGLYLPLYRVIETFAETVVMKETRDESDTAAIAQGAAEQLAKNKCPAGAEILDKWIEYSMIDNEYVYAAVVLEYEGSIAVREDAAGMGP